MSSVTLWPPPPTRAIYTDANPINQGALEGVGPGPVKKKPQRQPRRSRKMVEKMVEVEKTVEVEKIVAVSADVHVSNIGTTRGLGESLRKFVIVCTGCV